MLRRGTSTVMYVKANFVGTSIDVDKVAYGWRSDSRDFIPSSDVRAICLFEEPASSVAHNLFKPINAGYLRLRSVRGISEVSEADRLAFHSNV